MVSLGELNRCKPYFYRHPSVKDRVGADYTETPISDCIQTVAEIVSSVDYIDMHGHYDFRLCFYLLHGDHNAHDTIMLAFFVFNLAFSPK